MIGPPDRCIRRLGDVEPCQFQSLSGIIGPPDPCFYLLCFSCISCRKRPIARSPGRLPPVSGNPSFFVPPAARMAALGLFWHPKSVQFLPRSLGISISVARARFVVRRRARNGSGTVCSFLNFAWLSTPLIDYTRGEKRSTRRCSISGATSANLEGKAEANSATLAALRRFPGFMPAWATSLRKALREGSPCPPRHRRIMRGALCEWHELSLAVPSAFSQSRDDPSQSFGPSGGQPRK